MGRKLSYEDFLSHNRSLLIAPAGHGKTHAIVECLKILNNKCLVLTHTNAGVHSLRSKIEEAHIDDDKYQVATIDGFARLLVSSFSEKYDKDDEFDYVQDKAITLLELDLIQQYIVFNFGRVIVDEYQDCSKKQHKLIQILSKNIPSHALGDHLQGIFDFNAELVSFEYDLDDYEKFDFLNTPYRWINSGNANLGEQIFGFRKKLESGEPIDITTDKEIGLFFYEIDENEKYDPKSQYSEILTRIVNNKKGNKVLDSLLILMPEYWDDKGQKKGGEHDRLRLKNQFDHADRLEVLVPVSKTTVKNLCNKIDNLMSCYKEVRKPENRIKKDLLSVLFRKTDVDSWFNKDGMKNKVDASNKIKSEYLSFHIREFYKHGSLSSIEKIIIAAEAELKMKVRNSGLYREVKTLIRLAIISGKPVMDEFEGKMNLQRRLGKRINKKCIGSTLLTKGLEFDTVVILDAHRFSCPKNLYVALSRCCEMLIVISNSKTLRPEY
jgi:DNA helicase-2/ATP-dependent DNA helicase PcrA